MTRVRLPFALAGLLRLVTSSNPALAGDIEESFRAGTSRLWLWRQLLAAAALTIWDKRHPTPTVVRIVTASPFDRPDRGLRLLDPAPFILGGSRIQSAGGLGLLAAIVLITIVMPAAWFLVLLGLAGGVVVGIVLVRRRRTRGLDGPIHRRPLGLFENTAPVSGRAAGKSATGHGNEPLAVSAAATA
jgi:hypothetical protein